MIEPFPNWRSIVATVASRSFSRSLSMGMVGVPQRGGGGGERLYSTTGFSEVKPTSGQILVAWHDAGVGMVAPVRARGGDARRVLPRGDPPARVPATIRARAR